jgi:hypothetical protein
MPRMLQAILAAPFDSWLRIPARASRGKRNRLGAFWCSSRFSSLTAFVDEDMSERMIRNFALAVDHLMPTAVRDSAMAFACLEGTLVLNGKLLRLAFDGDFPLLIGHCEPPLREQELGKLHGELRG